MLTIMLVTGDKSLEDALADAIKARNDADGFGLRTVSTAAEAAHILTTTPVDMVIADMAVPDEEAPRWLSSMRDSRQDAPFLLLADKSAAPALSGFKGIWLVRKPAPPAKLFEAAVTIAQKEAKAFVAGAHIGHFIQVITSDNKTCSLTARSRGRVGTLYFMQGQLVDAVYGNYRGKDAALYILCWQEEANIEVRKLYGIRKRVIRESVDALIMESCQMKDGAPVETARAQTGKHRISSDLLAMILSIEGLVRMAAIMRDGTLVAQKNSGDHLGSLMTYMSMELERVRSLLDWTGPDHMVLTCKTGEKYIIIFGPAIIVGLQTAPMVSAAEVVSTLSNAVLKAKIEG